MKGNGWDGFKRCDARCCRCCYCRCVEWCWEIVAVYFQSRVSGLKENQKHHENVTFLSGAYHDVCICGCFSSPANQWKVLRREIQ